MTKKGDRVAYQPHTDADVQRMLERLGLGDVEELFAPIPAELRAPAGLDLPRPHAEQEIAAEMARLAGRNRHMDELACFLGAGVYDHYVPAVVWYLAGRGEFATAYTPYQPEMSQGVLQALFEYQTLISELTGCAVSNASLYDGASSVAEAAVMAVAATGRTELLVSGLLAPRVRELLATYAAGLGVELVEVATVDGRTDLDDARRKAGDRTAALLLAQPNFLGVLEDIPAAAELARAAGAKLVVSFDPIAAGVLEPPGRLGADIVVGEGQALGNHPNFGGPAFGFLACGTDDVRRLPGRLVGETVDAAGTRGYVLTLQAREQHIRREKATSNICTNQTLNALAAAVYLAWLGPAGLAELASTCHRAAHYAAERLTAVPGVELAFPGRPFFKEFTLRLPADPEEVCRRLADRGHLAGLPLTGRSLPGGAADDLGGRGLLVAVTERRTRAEIDALADDLGEVVAELAPNLDATPGQAAGQAAAYGAAAGESPEDSVREPLPAEPAVTRSGVARQAPVAEPAPWAAGGRGDAIAEPLIFERSAPGRRASTLPDPAAFPAPAGPTAIPAAARRRSPLLLPEVSERDLVRHYTRLAHRNYAIDLGFYPLGSCTMKYNPKIAETAAALPGFARLHPAQPTEQVQGALELLWRLEHALKELTGMAAVTFQPAAGAHGEFTGLLLIRAWHEANGDPRRRVVIPDAAHGTNPASVRLAGFEVTTVKSSKDGLIDLDALAAALGPDVAAFMITNPNTLGLFERNIHKVAELVHGVGAQLYYDGANFNAILGKVRPGDMGFDVVHMNLHKTFATPHGGGGPGAGPVGVAEHLTAFLPGPVVTRMPAGDGRAGDRYAWDGDRPRSIGRVHGWHGNFGIIVRAYAYLLANGGEGLRQVAERAVLNANYLLDRLLDGYELGYPTRPVMHEFVLSARKQRAHGARALDLAKALIDAGYHPPTVYFPLIVDEAMMVEPTETESLETLDAFAGTLLALGRQAEQDPSPLREAPTTAPARRLDEARAARQLTTRWTPTPPSPA